MESLFILSLFLGPWFMVLAVCGLLADYVLPRCPRLIRFLERVLDVDLEGDFDE